VRVEGAVRGMWQQKQRDVTVQGFYLGNMASNLVSTTGCAASDRPFSAFDVLC
jgi:hypothetical protein